MTNQNYDVKVRRTEIIVPHREERLTFISPAKGPGNYLNVTKQVLDDGLKLPKGEYLASLLHGAYCGPEEFRNHKPVKNIRNIIREDWICVPNINLWTSEKQENSGVFVVYDEKGVGLTEELNLGKLEKELEDGGELIVNGTKIKISKDRKLLC